jgi:hypothetical protein
MQNRVFVIHSDIDNHKDLNSHELMEKVVMTSLTETFA